MLTTCRKCKTEQEHYPSYPWACKKCIPKRDPKKRREYEAQWRAANRESQKAYLAKWYAGNQDKVKAYRQQNKARIRERTRQWALKTKFGLTVEDFDRMLASQSNACAVCQTVAPKTGWHIDHCHSTGKVRGILCTNCNPMLGFAKDNTDTLKAAIRYLEKHQ